MLYSLHSSNFIRPESKASLTARWTWGLHSWWAAHIKWQPLYLWTDGAARLNSDVCFSAVADAEMILGRGERYLSCHCLVRLSHKAPLNLQHIRQIGVLGCEQAVDHIHISNYFSSPDRNCMPLWLVLSIAWPGTSGFCQRMKNKHRCADVSYVLFYCTWFNLIKCAVWLSRSQVKGNNSSEEQPVMSRYCVICNRLRVAQFDSKGLTPLSVL